MIKERLISAIIGTLLILACQPFGLYAFPETRWLLLLGITACVFTSCIGSEYILRYVLRMPLKKAEGMRYAIKRNMAFQVINVCMMTTLLALFLDKFASNDKVDNHISLENTMIILGVVIGVSIILGLYWKNVYWKRHYMKELADAQRLNGILEERRRSLQTKMEKTDSKSKKFKDEASANSDATEDSSAEDIYEDAPILLEGTTKESVSLLPSNFIYAESDGNYVSVFYLKSGEISKTVLRASIKSVVQTLDATHNIIQCHRAFIVNVTYVEQVEGRSSGIGLKLKDINDVIPVSKSYVAEVKQLIQNPN